MEEASPVWSGLTWPLVLGPMDAQDIAAGPQILFDEGMCELKASLISPLSQQSPGHWVTAFPCIPRPSLLLAQLVVGAPGLPLPLVLQQLVADGVPWHWALSFCISADTENNFQGQRPFPLANSP